MSQLQQTFASHRRWHPLFHFFIFPVLAANAVFQFSVFLRHNFSWPGLWNVVVAIALAGTAYIARINALRVQDRLIRLEEQVRLRQLLPSELQPRIPELRTRHLVALRFASDEELADLVRAILNGEVRKPADIKRRVRNWRGDYLRV